MILYKKNNVHELLIHYGQGQNRVRRPEDHLQNIFLLAHLFFSHFHDVLLTFLQKAFASLETFSVLILPYQRSIPLFYMAH